MDGLMAYVMKAKQETSKKTTRVTTKTYVDFICIIIEVWLSLEANIPSEELQYTPLNNNSYRLSVVELVPLQTYDDVIFIFP